MDAVGTTLFIGMRPCAQPGGCGTPWNARLTRESSHGEEVGQEEEREQGETQGRSEGGEEVVREALRPTPEEIAEAKQIIQAFAEAVADNRAALMINGRFIDPPVVRWAEQILQAAAQQN